MRATSTTLLTLALLGAPALPAEAHIVYFKDGTVVRGTVALRESAVVISGAGAELSFPLSTVRAISFTDEPIAYEQQRVEESRVLNHDAVVWSLVAANVAAVVAALVGAMR
ncbi:MAG: hypothetical protein VKS61_13980 [Candidatus Sericytochromatia bacterium]|nr:hypothetical protein [Candidatus Sericytochromatia bacterium]